MIKFKQAFIFVFISTLTFICQAQENLSDWRYFKDIKIEDSGLIRLKLPYETTDASHSSLKDIRLMNSDGVAIPYLLDEPREGFPTLRPPTKMKSALIKNETVLIMNTGTGEVPIDAVTIKTVATNFIKSVTIDGANDLNNWKTLQENQPIFGQNGISQLKIGFSKSSWKFLRVRIDDSKSSPLPISGVLLSLGEKEIPKHDVVDLKIQESTNQGKVSHYICELPQKNMYISAIEIRADDKIFNRQINVFKKNYVEGQASELLLTSGFIYSLQILNQKTSSSMVVPVRSKLDGKEIILTIPNGDSPPLKISGFKADVIPSSLVFSLPKSQTIRIYYGNKGAEQPSYDVVSLTTQIKEMKARDMVVPDARQDNPTYQPKEVLPALEQMSSEIDVSNWPNRKPIQVSSVGVQRLELDLEVMAQMQLGGGDMRVVQNGKQIPYLFGPLGPEKKSSPVVKPIESSDPHLSSWALTLPFKNISILELSCSITDLIFDRSVSLYEEIADERGSKFRNLWGQTQWKRTPNQEKNEFGVSGMTNYSSQTNPGFRLHGDTLILVVQNGDNPALNLSNFEIHTRAPQLVFKTNSKDDIWLYYGNQKANRPQYDINVVAQELMDEEKSAAELGKEEILKAAQWWKMPALAGPIKFLFWGVLGLVVILLIVVIAKLLPEESPPK